MSTLKTLNIETPILNDQDYVLLDDGRILSVHGTQVVRESDPIVGEIAFIPDRLGTYQVNGTTYSKPYFVANGTRKLSTDGRTTANPLPAHLGYLLSYKSTVTKERIIKIWRTEEMLATGLAGNNGSTIRAVIEEAKALIPALRECRIGLTGSGGLACQNGGRVLHDVDLTIHALTDEGSAAVTEQLQRLLTARPEYRIYEYGKDWRLRYRTPSGILCPFISSAASESVVGALPWTGGELHGAEMLDVNGVVVDATRSAHTPVQLIIRSMDNTKSLYYLYCYDLRARAEFAVGERGRFKGMGLRSTIATEAGGCTPLLVAEASHMINLTPPWQGYRQ
ncbi:hypothetical protein [Gordonia sp. ABSL49_1]|uniref:hypothetical protein n=1 Tax=Gordonia sp. ABSL49_1 TaxID=2920941 RepID=UPI001F0F6ADA|nr:hypothetical protein [Gordonia sp. ABSL49_1]MCH5644438.1 hypothetical protein [Gordonia sp. ABSL49_1]